MIQDVLHARLAEYAPRHALEQENILQEVMQEYVLASLAKAGFFSVAVFHGGTCLRLLHGMQRFSEDLDFMLKKADLDFKWNTFLEVVRRDCAAEGIAFEALDRATAGTAVRKAFLKTDSIGSLLYFKLPFGRQRTQKLRIKLEVDTNPPAGSSAETAYLAFPRTVALAIQTLPSGFGTKLHALLCRKYVKGRDWYDFLWYVSRKVTPDLPLLANALEQQGPWEGDRQNVTSEWLITQLEHKIKAIDWVKAQDDVQRFLPSAEQTTLTHWGTKLFLYHLRRLSDYIQKI